MASSFSTPEVLRLGIRSVAAPQRPTPPDDAAQYFAMLDPTWLPTAHGVANRCIAGQSSLVLAMGAAQSGKSTTLFGSRNGRALGRTGLVHAVVNRLFDLRPKGTSTPPSFVVAVRIVETIPPAAAAKEKFRDLLQPSAIDKSFSLKKGGNSGGAQLVTIEGATTLVITTQPHFQQVLAEALEMRDVCRANRTSPASPALARSQHLIVQISLNNGPLYGMTTIVETGAMSDGALATANFYASAPAGSTAPPTSISTTTLDTLLHCLAEFRDATAGASSPSDPVTWPPKLPPSVGKSQFTSFLSPHLDGGSHLVAVLHGREETEQPIGYATVDVLQRWSLRLTKDTQLCPISGQRDPRVAVAEALCNEIEAIKASIKLIESGNAPPGSASKAELLQELVDATEAYQEFSESVEDRIARSQVLDNQRKRAVQKLTSDGKLTRLIELPRLVLLNAPVPHNMQSFYDLPVAPLTGTDSGTTSSSPNGTAADVRVWLGDPLLASDPTVQAGEVLLLTLPTAAVGAQSRRNYGELSVFANRRCVALTAEPQSDIRLNGERLSEVFDGTAGGSTEVRRQRSATLASSAQRTLGDAVRSRAGTVAGGGAPNFSFNDSFINAAVALPPIRNPTAIFLSENDRIVIGNLAFRVTFPPGWGGPDLTAAATVAVSPTGEPLTPTSAASVRLRPLCDSTSRREEPFSRAAVEGASEQQEQQRLLDEYDRLCTLLAKHAEMCVGRGSAAAHEAVPNAAKLQDDFLRTRAVLEAKYPAMKKAAPPPIGIPKDAQEALKEVENAEAARRATLEAQERARNEAERARKLAEEKAAAEQQLLLEAKRRALEDRQRQEERLREEEQRRQDEIANALAAAAAQPVTVRRTASQLLRELADDDDLFATAPVVPPPVPPIPDVAAASGAEGGAGTMDLDLNSHLVDDALRELDELLRGYEKQVKGAQEWKGGGPLIAADKAVYHARHPLTYADLSSTSGTADERFEGVAWRKKTKKFFFHSGEFVGVHLVLSGHFLHYFSAEVNAAGGGGDGAAQNSQGTSQPRDDDKSVGNCYVYGAVITPCGPIDQYPFCITIVPSVPRKTTKSTLDFTDANSLTLAFVSDTVRQEWLTALVRASRPEVPPELAKYFGRDVPLKNASELSHRKPVELQPREVNDFATEIVASRVDRKRLNAMIEVDALAASAEQSAVPPGPGTVVIGLPPTSCSVVLDEDAVEPNPLEQRALDATRRGVIAPLVTGTLTQPSSGAIRKQLLRENDDRNAAVSCDVSEGGVPLLAASCNFVGKLKLYLRSSTKPSDARRRAGGSGTLDAASTHKRMWIVDHETGTVELIADAAEKKAVVFDAATQLIRVDRIHDAWQTGCRVSFFVEGYHTFLEYFVSQADRERFYDSVTACRINQWMYLPFIAVTPLSTDQPFDAATFRKSQPFVAWQRDACRSAEDVWPETPPTTVSMTPCAVRRVVLNTSSAAAAKPSATAAAEEHSAILCASTQLFEGLRIWTGTVNVRGVPFEDGAAFSHWIPFLHADIAAIAVQGTQYQSYKGQFTDFVVRVSGEQDFMVLESACMFDVCLVVVVRRPLYSLAQAITTVTAPSGLDCLYGERGGVIVTFSMLMSTFAFVAVHLPSAEPDIRRFVFSEVVAAAATADDAVNLHDGVDDFTDLLSRTDHVFFMGDFNSQFTSKDWPNCEALAKAGQYTKLAQTADQLVSDCAGKRVALGCTEASIGFPPTAPIVERHAVFSASGALHGSISATQIMPRSAPLGRQQGVLAKVIAPPELHLCWPKGQPPSSLNVDGNGCTRYSGRVLFASQRPERTQVTMYKASFEWAGSGHALVSASFSVKVLRHCPLSFFLPATSGLSSSDGGAAAAATQQQLGIRISRFKLTRHLSLVSPTTTNRGHGASSRLVLRIGSPQGMFPSKECSLKDPSVASGGQTQPDEELVNCVFAPGSAMATEFVAQTTLTFSILERPEEAVGTAVSASSPPLPVVIHGSCGVPIDRLCSKKLCSGTSGARDPPPAQTVRVTITRGGRLVTSATFLAEFCLL